MFSTIPFYVMSTYSILKVPLPTNVLQSDPLLLRKTRSYWCTTRKKLIYFNRLATNRNKNHKCYRALSTHINLMTPGPQLMFMDVIRLVTL